MESSPEMRNPFCVIETTRSIFQFLPTFLNVVKSVSFYFTCKVKN